MVVAANYRELNRKCPNCGSRNQFNEVTYDVDMEYIDSSMSLRCPKCQYEDDISPYILVLEFYVTKDREILIFTQEDFSFTADMKTRLYLAANIKHEPLTKVNTLEPGKYSVHVYYKKCDNEPSYIIDEVYHELLQPYYDHCTYCNDKFVRREMYKGIIYGSGYSKRSSSVDGRFLLCKKHFNELKAFVK